MTEISRSHGWNSVIERRSRVRAQSQFFLSCHHFLLSCGISNFHNAVQMKHKVENCTRYGIRRTGKQQPKKPEPAASESWSLPASNCAQYLPLSVSNNVLDMWGKLIVWLPLSNPSSSLNAYTYIYVCVWLSNVSLPFALTAIDTDYAVALLVEGKGVVKKPIHGVCV